MSQKMVSLKEFIDSEIEDLDRFKQWWERESRKHRKEPQMFPELLGLGDWFDQYLLFCSSETANDKEAI